jgi:tetratricopeptide (TPR) repeat protein
VAENLADLGNDVSAIEVLKNSVPHYLIPYGCVQSALALLGQGQNQSVRQILGLGIEILPYTAGRGGEEVQFQLIKIATVLEEPVLVQQAWDKFPGSQVTLQTAFEAYQQDWKPNLWNRLKDWLDPSRQWKDLKKDAKREEQIAWGNERVADAFTAMLFIKEAEARAYRGERYPAHWIEFARTGVRTTTPNTRPVAIQAELSALAALEGKKEDAVLLAKSAFGMMQGWAPQMNGLYPIIRNLAVRLGSANVKEEEKRFFLSRMVERLTLLQNQLDTYEQMLQLPLLAEAFAALGDTAHAQACWKRAVDLCAMDKNPEGQSIGLTRIWMSYARANTWPTNEIEAPLGKIEKQLPAAYSKVNF